MSLCKIANVGATATLNVGYKIVNSATNSLGACRCASSGSFNPSSPTMYDCRKYGHHMPTNSVMTPFEPLACFPTGVFRCTAGELLGRGANKCGMYRNPEYFSFHHMTFYDMHMLLRCFRKPSPDTGRKPN